MSKTKIDYNILFLLFLFMVISCFYIYEAQGLEQYSTNFFIRQFVFYIGLFILVIAMSFIDIDYIKQAHWFLYVFGIIILVGLLVVPASFVWGEDNGAIRWYRLPVIGSFQPAELTKIFLIITLSYVVSKHKEWSSKWKGDFWLIIKLAVLCSPVALLLIEQPDMGTIMQIAAIVLSVLLVSKVSLKWTLSIIIVPVSAILGFVYLYFARMDLLEKYVFVHLQDYQVRRFHGLLNPTEYITEAYQVNLALRAVGSGRLSGTGAENNLYYIPEAHTDFIFAIIAHTHGFIAACLIISLYFILLYQIVMIGFQSTNQFDVSICAGVAGLFAFQIFQNIGMNVGLLPVTGFSLPMISYGGTSLITAGLSIGLVLCVKANRKEYMFEKTEDM
ncbi:FtsW/RodA/SpoVE family cell cycle protein [Alkalicoccobacillus plakortidis]|uniref:FtsW/RodA/SpoVE family cell cycle protein n=1 Tax=Alkalicoccobacillus plakortidis TaxID=444060 RepID=A0ABT0XHF3_9BACI|nr:FtsW/RodA/SpoVE family cell cycle protein [Alkalicoccobacillus plakortidis]MCM2675348.1 FtsW/RodA/SpoVE family cell cycle protein [Alkalicoccobacillus plakortidis]